MLIFYRCHGIGILLFLVHTTSSFVLLTANIDDVKKLASKFVSESLAEKIAEFIAKATEHMITNVSDEGIMDQVSEENKKYNIARERKEAGNQKVSEDLSIASYEGIEPAEAVDDKRNKNVANTERIKTISDSRYTDGYRPENNMKFVNGKQEKVRFVTKRDRDMQPHYIKASRDNSLKDVPSKIGDVKGPARQYCDMQSNGHMNSKYVQSKPKYKPKQMSHPNIAVSTIGYAENIGVDEFKEGKKLKSRINHSRNHKVPTKKQLEVNEVEVHNKNETDSSIPRALKELTTKKIRTAFDQYDNINYPKSDFIATSGPVALPKIPNKKWIETDEDVTKKFWF